VAHVRGFERVFADAAGERRRVFRRRFGRDGNDRRFTGRRRDVVVAGQVEAAAGQQAQQRHHGEADPQADETGEVLRTIAEIAQVADDTEGGGEQHGADPHRVEVVQV